MYLASTTIIISRHPQTEAAIRHDLRGPCIKSIFPGLRQTFFINFLWSFCNLSKIAWTSSSPPFQPPFSFCIWIYKFSAGVLFKQITYFLFQAPFKTPLPILLDVIRIFKLQSLASCRLLGSLSWLELPLFQIHFLQHSSSISTNYFLFQCFLWINAYHLSCFGPFPSHFLLLETSFFQRLSSCSILFIRLFLCEPEFAKSAKLLLAQILARFILLEML